MGGYESDFNRGKDDYVKGRPFRPNQSTAYGQGYREASKNKFNDFSVFRNQPEFNKLWDKV